MRCFRNSYQKSNLQDFSINPLRNSPYSRLTQEGIFQNVKRDNIPLSQNSMSFGNYRRFPQQESTIKNLDNFPKSLDRRETFSQEKLTRGYPLVVPSRRIFDKLENLFFRNPRNKYSEFSSEDYKKIKDDIKIENDSTKVPVYRADRDTKSSWENSKDTSNVIQSEKSFPKIENIYRLRREDVDEEILDEEKNAMKKSSNSASQLKYPQERYNFQGFGPSEVKRTPYVKDIDIPKSTKEFFDNWDVAKDSSESLNLGQLKNNLLEVHPMKKPEIIAKNSNEQINSNSYNSKFPQDFNTWKSSKNGDSLNSLMTTNTRYFENEDNKDVKEYFENESEHFMNKDDMKEYFEDDTEHFMDKDDMKEYFEDEIEEDTIETKQNNYNPYMLPQNIWKRTENEELLNDLDFIRENSQETGQTELYFEENNKYFQDNEQNEDVIFQDKGASAKAARAPVINAYNAYILPRYLNIVNDKKYSAKSETQELSEVKNDVRANPIIKMDQRFFKDEAIIKNNTRLQDLILPKDIFEVEEYSSPIANKQNNIRNKNEAPIELDPDLLDDIEDPSIETTESTLI